LQADAESVRLRKAPADNNDASRPATVGGQPLRRRRYVLLCLALAALERSDAQTTLGRLADAVVTGSTDPALASAGVRLDLDTREDRTDLVAAVRVLLDLGVLSRVAGDESGYVRGPGDALYDVDRRVLAGMLVTRRGPSTITEQLFDERLDAVTRAIPLETDDARNRSLRHALTRRLLDDPVVYHDDLASDELAYLTSQRSAILRRISEATGLVGEVRAEGIAMVDPAGRDALTDVLMPEEGTDGHVTLLVAEYLAAAYQAAPSRQVALDDVRRHVADLAQRHRTLWRKGVADAGGGHELTALALDRLVGLGLARRYGHAVKALPALARFRVGEPLVPDSQLGLSAGGAVGGDRT
jgi:uncharacterized protein (TIGR02678 family)